MGGVNLFGGLKLTPDQLALNKGRTASVSIPANQPHVTKLYQLKGRRRVHSYQVFYHFHFGI